ncbi:MAG: hypothetical protein Q4A75_05390 [Peptostreptococcaceae bacterium]|nr:hypothetical protein [Peptostreptococcaceae bacterium]
MRYKKLVASVALAAVLSSNLSYAAPHQFKAFHRIPIWDKHLTPYDENGDLITSPKKTTFGTTTASESDRVKFYAAPAEVGERIEMKFLIDTDAKKSWFEKISEIVVVNEYDKVQGDALVFEEVAGDPRFPTTKIIQVVPNRYLENNRRHRIRIRSAGGPTQFFGVHVVQKEVPKLIYSSGAKIGEDIVFEVENMNYGFGMPITLVEMKRPDGSVHQLKYEDEYWLVGKILRIFNGAIDQEGVYSLKVHADGFKSFEKKFEIQGRVSGNSDGGSLKSIVPKAVVGGVDVVSSATGGGGSPGGGGGDAGGGGSLHVPADLIFNEDLLSNALLLGELGIKNEHAEAIVKRWKFGGVIDLVMNDGFTDVYSYNRYLDAVKDAKLKKNRYLSFEDFVKLGLQESKDRPYEIHEVLEDGRLGAGQRSYLLKGKSTPKFAIRQMELGKDLVIQFENGAEYLKAIEKILLPGTLSALSSADYQVEGDRLVLKTNKLGRGRSSIEIIAKDYKPLKIGIDLQPKREDLNLQAEGKLKLGYEVRITGMSPDLVKNVKKIAVNGPGIAASEAGLLHRDGLGDVDPAKDRYYYWDGAVLVISAGTFREAGDHILQIVADHYPALQVAFAIGAKEEVDDSQMVKNILDIGKKTVSRGFDSIEVLAVAVKDADAKMELQRKGIELYINGQKQKPAWTVGSMNSSSTYIWSKDTPEIFILPSALSGDVDVIRIVVGEQEVMFELDALAQVEKQTGAKGTLEPRYAFKKAMMELEKTLEKAKALDTEGKSASKAKELKDLIAEIEAKKATASDKAQVESWTKALEEKIREVENSQPDSNGDEKREVTEAEKEFPLFKDYRMFGTNFASLSLASKSDRDKLKNMMTSPDKKVAVTVNDVEYLFEQPRERFGSAEDPADKKYDFGKDNDPWAMTYYMRFDPKHFRDQSTVVLRSGDRELVLEIDATRRTDKIVSQREYILPASGSGPDQPAPPVEEPKEKQWVELAEGEEKFFPEIASYRATSFEPSKLQFKNGEDMLKMKELLKDQSILVNDTTYGYQEAKASFGGFGVEAPKENKFQFYSGILHEMQMWYGAFKGDDEIRIEIGEHRLVITIEKEKLVSQKEYRYR